jgi:hypothetical protein
VAGDSFAAATSGHHAAGSLQQTQICFLAEKRICLEAVRVSCWQRLALQRRSHRPLALSASVSTGFRGGWALAWRAKEMVLKATHVSRRCRPWPSAGPTDDGCMGPKTAVRAGHKLLRGTKYQEEDERTAGGNSPAANFFRSQALGAPISSECRLDFDQPADLLIILGPVCSRPCWLR